MLSYILAMIVGLGSVAFYMAAFFFPEVYRKGDFVWSSIGFFYALVLWFCAGQIGGAVLLGQTASVALVAWLGWQTLKLRRETTPLAEQTSTAAIAQSGILPTAIAEKITTVFQSGNQSATVDTPVSVPQPTPEVSAVFPDLGTPTGETVMESMTLEPTERSMPTPSADDSFQESRDPVVPALTEPEIGVEGAEFTPISTTQDARVSKAQVEEDWQDTFDEPVSTPNPVPPPAPARAVSPKSRTFGFLAASLDRLKGLLSKGKPQPPAPKATQPISPPPVVSQSAAPETIESQKLETVAFPETVEMAMTQGLDILESAEALESVLEEETRPASPSVEIAVSPAPEALESVLEEETRPSSPPVEIAVSPAPEALESVLEEETPPASPSVEIAVSPAPEALESVLEEETPPASPPVEILVSQQITIVTPDEAIDSLFAAEGETSQSPPAVEILISQEIKTVEVSDAEAVASSEALTPEKSEPLPSDWEASIAEDKASSADDTRSTPNG